MEKIYKKTVKFIIKNYKKMKETKPSLLKDFLDFPSFFKFFFLFVRFSRGKSGLGRQFLNNFLKRIFCNLMKD
jgi:hypothetical protein